MFGKFKSALGDGAIKSAIDAYSDKINEKLAEMTALKPAQVQDDTHYRNYVITPALTAIVLSSGAATKLIPDFEQRFARAMLHVRDQLVVVDKLNDKVTLVPDYRSRVGDVLIEGFKQNA